MKKVTLLFFTFLLINVSHAQIWVNTITSGRPINNAFLGDKISSGFNFQFEIGQSSWNKSEVGIGQNPDGTTDWNWTDAIWYEDGTPPNKKVQRNIGNFQFTATGNWFVVGRARANEADSWTYADEGGWNNETTLTANTTEKSCPYFVVSALSAPTNQTATSYSRSQISLSWAKSDNKNVMILARKVSDAPANTPVQGTSYSVGSKLGTGKVVYKGSATSAIIPGLNTNTEYVFTFYTWNNDYYSVDATSATAKTLSDEWYDDYVTINESQYAMKGTGVSLDGVNLGTVSSLIINSASLKYSDINIGDPLRTGSAYYYSIYDDTDNKVVGDIENILSQASLGNFAYHATTNTATTNLVIGLTTAKTYVLHIWAKSWNGTEDGDSWLSNNGNDYKVTFTKALITDVKNAFESSVKIMNTSGNLTASFDGNATIELFNANGQLLKSTKASNVYSQDLKSGLYLLRINGTAHKVIVK